MLMKEWVVHNIADVITEAAAGLWWTIHDSITKGSTKLSIAKLFGW